MGNNSLNGIMLDTGGLGAKALLQAVGKLGAIADAIGGALGGATEAGVDATKGIGSITNGEVLAADGTVLAKLNPVTGTYDVVTPGTSLFGGGGATIPSGFQAYELPGLSAGSQGVVDSATGEIKVLTPNGTLTDVPPTPIPANIPATVVQQSETGIQWGGSIYDQGIPFENFLEGQLPAGSRLPPNYPTIDFFDTNTGVVTSAKTLDTMTAAKIVDPTQVYYSLKSNVDALATFDGGTLSKTTVNSAEITTRDLQVAIPAGTTPAQWTQIQKAIIDTFVNHDNHFEFQTLSLRG